MSKSSSKLSFQNLIVFLRLRARLELKNRRPTFPNFLGLAACSNHHYHHHHHHHHHRDNNNHNDEDITDTQSTAKFHVRENQFSFLNSNRTIAFRYRLPLKRLRYLFDNDDNDSMRQQFPRYRYRHRHPNLSTYMSIMDEVTTWDFILSSLPYPKPGVSVTMSSQWGPEMRKKMTTTAAISSSSSLSLPSSSSGVPGSDEENEQEDDDDDDDDGEEVDIVTTITKTGRNLGFVRAEIRDPLTGGMLCFFDHVKYLPSSWFISMILTPIGRSILNLYLQFSLRLNTNKHVNLDNDDRNENENDYKTIMDSFRIVTNADDDNNGDDYDCGSSNSSSTTASFEVGKYHTNGLGGLHGGVQAILMERLGRIVAREEFSKLHHNTTSIIKNDDDNNDVISTSDDDPTSIINENFVVDCDRIHVSYQSSASECLDLRAYVLDPPTLDRPTSVTIRIDIIRGVSKTANNNNSSSSSSNRIANNDTSNRFKTATITRSKTDNQSSNSSRRQKPVTVVVSEGTLTFVKIPFLKNKT